jgi:hypothetical protein
LCGCGLFVGGFFGVGGVLFFVFGLCFGVCFVGER